MAAMVFPSGKTKKNVDCSDEAICAGLVQGSGRRRDEAIKCLYATCLPAIRGMVLKNSGTESDAEDLFQDVLCILLRNIDILEKELTGSPQAYLQSIARRRWLNVLRTHRSRGGRWAEFKDEGISDNPAGMTELLERERFFEAQEACLTQMTPKCQAILGSIYTNGRQRMDTLAEQQELANAHTARQTKYRCLQSLKACILKRLTMTDDDHESTI